MLNYILVILTKLIGSIKWPYSHKKFNLKDFSIINEMIKYEPFIPILVTNYGNIGSNFLIKIAQWIGIRKWSKKTHVLISIGNNRVVESSGTEGIREITLLEAIGQRDEVMILKSHLGKKVDENSRYFLLNLLEMDDNKAIGYDDNHDLADSSKYDCSELFFKSYNYGLKKNGIPTLKPVRRFWRNSYSPLDVEMCKMLTIKYDSNKRGVK